jgi:macrolide-specific efflux system membrane fusion protein
MFRIVRIDRLRVEAFLDSQHAAGSLVGRDVTLTIEPARGEPRTYSGKIVFVSPEVDPVNGQIRVWAEVENRGGQLRPGVHGKLAIASPPADAPKPVVAE